MILLSGNGRSLLGIVTGRIFIEQRRRREIQTHNLPNCSSCPGLYELGIAVSLPKTESKNSTKLSSKRIIPVYLGQADNVRTRPQQYDREGPHLENGWSNREQIDRKVLGLFSDIFSYGFEGRVGMDLYRACLGGWMEVGWGWGWESGCWGGRGWTIFIKTHTQACQGAIKTVHFPELEPDELERAKNSWRTSLR
ncbi:hypothetical protein L1887_03373 [Cichorium endivia]|nr:hypothetical protein L1887_03373 [Cichorium endivia]